jgi:hypothetical protein
METVTKKISITSDEFFSGIIAGLSYYGVEKFKINDTLHKSMVEVSQGHTEVDLLFLLKLNPYGLSHGVESGLSGAHMRGLVYYRSSFDNNVYIGIRHNSAIAILDGLPGGRGVYLGMVDELLDKFITVY